MRSIYHTYICLYLTFVYIYNTYIHACVVYGARGVSVGQDAYSPRGSRAQATLPRDERCSGNYISTR